MFQRPRPDISDILPATTNAQRLEALVKDITATWDAVKSLTHSDSGMLMRALVGYLTHYGESVLPETVLHSLTVHAFVQLFAFATENTNDREDEEEPDEKDTEQELTLSVEPTLGE